METLSQSSRFAAAVDAIYDCALAPDRWPAALETIADTFGDVGAVMTYRRDDGQFVVITSPRLADGQDEYNRIWHKHDVRAIASAKMGYLLPGNVFTDSSLGLAEIMDTHPFYTVFLKKRGLRWFAGVSISPDPHTFVAVSLMRSDTKPDFTDEECDALARLGLHAEKTMRLSLRLIEAEHWKRSLSETFGRLNMGLFLVDGLGQVVFSNNAGERLCGNGIDIVDGRVTGTGSSGRQVQDAVGEVLRGDGLSHSMTAPILIRQQPETLAIYVIPLRPGANPDLEPFAARARAIVLAFEIKAGQAIDPSLIRDFLGLTLGEARIAALVASGISPRDASLKLGISEATARTVLKRVFAKAGVSRQSELAALIGKMTFPQAHAELRSN